MPLRRADTPSPSEETIYGPFFRSESLRVDFISISQRHDSPLPDIHGGQVQVLDSHGQIVRRDYKPLILEGAFGSCVQVKCVNSTVFFSGNPSRFGKADNLHGLTWPKALATVNSILASHGLPPFTLTRPASKGIPDVELQATVHRLDICTDIATGSSEEATLLIQHLAAQKMSGLKQQHIHHLETVRWGGGKNGGKQFQVYIKANELAQKGASEAASAALEQCRQQGLVRFEGRFKGKGLSQHGALTLDALVTRGGLNRLFEEMRARSEILSRRRFSASAITGLPRHLRSTFEAFRTGKNLRETLPRATWYRHRTGLLVHGIDIAAPLPAQLLNLAAQEAP